MSDKLTTATLVVQYQISTDQQSIIVAEIDEEKHEGSNFAPGETIYFRIYSNCTFDMFLSDSNASVSLDGSGQKAVEENLISFIQTKELSISYPYSGGWSFQWHGVPRLEGVAINTPLAPEANKTGFKLTVDGDLQKLVAAGKLAYNANYTRYRLTPGESYDGYSIIVLIKERAA